MLLVQVLMLTGFNYGCKENMPGHLHPGRLACLTPVPALPGTDLELNGCGREERGAGAKSRQAAAVPSDLVNILPLVYISLGKERKYEVGRFRHHFIWRTTEGLFWRRCNQGNS